MEQESKEDIIKEDIKEETKDEIKDSDSESVVVESEILTEILNERYAEVLINCLSEEILQCEKQLLFIKEIKIFEKAVQTIHKIANKMQIQLMDNFFTHPVFKCPEYNLYAAQINDDVDCNIDTLYLQIDSSIPILKEKLHINLMNAVDQIKETYYKTRKVRD